MRHASFSGRLLGAAVLCGLVGCPAPAAPHASREGTVSVAGGTVHVNLHGRSLEVGTADGKPLGDLVLYIGGQAYHTVNGKLELPPEALAAAGGLVVMAPGYVPGKVALDKDGHLLLVPAGTPATYPPGGAPYQTPDGTVTVDLPAEAAASAVTVAPYTPPDAGLQQDLLSERAALPGNGGPCDQPFTCGPVDAALGILVTIDGPIPRGSRIALSYDLDAMLHGWNGRDPAPWIAAPDAWSPLQRQDALAAARILATFARLAADPKDLAALEDRYGLSLSGHVLAFVATPDPSPATDGVAVIEVAGSTLLGVRLEVTLVSSLAGALPGAAGGPVPTASFDPGRDLPVTATGGARAMQLPGAAPGDPAIPVTLAGAVAYDEGGNPIPADLLGKDGLDVLAPAAASLISDGASTLISDGGASVLGNNGASLIDVGGGALISDSGAEVVSNNGGGLVSNNGGSLAGTLRVPFQGGNGKYHLTAYTDYLWPDAQIAVVRRPGFSYSPVASTDRNGAFTLTGIPQTPGVVCVEAKTGGYTLYTLAAAPGAAAIADVNLDATTTLLGAWTLEQVRRRAARLSEVSLPGFAADVAALKPLMTQQDAGDAVKGPLSRVAAQADKLFRRVGYRPKALTPWTRVSTFVGAPGSRGWNDGTGGTAQMSGPTGLTYGPDGALYVWNFLQVPPTVFETLRRVDATGATTTLSSSGAFVANPATRVNTRAGLNGSFAPDGTLYYAGCNPVTSNLRRRSPGGVPTLFAGPPTLGGGPAFVDGVGLAARFAWPGDVVVDRAGILYVADTVNHAIRKVTPAGVVTTLAGGEGADGQGAGGGHVDGPLAAARFSFPRGLAFDTMGHLLVAEMGGHCVRQIDLAAGTASTLAGSTNGEAGLVNAPGTAARFSMPAGLAVGADGTIYVADLGNNRIRSIAPDGFVRTVAGVDVGPSYLDGTGAFSGFDAPHALAVDPAGNLIVADTYNYCLRRIERLP